MADTTAPADRRRIGFVAVAVAFLLTTLGATLPAPLYALWAPAFGFGPRTTTALFAVYAVGTILAIEIAGSWSDRAGRRPLIAAAVVSTVASSVLFLVAHAVAVLFAARFLSGIATGVMTAAATAALGELTERASRARTWATVANLGGLGLGPVVGGVFAEVAPRPTVTVYWAYLAVVVLTGLGLLRLPETVADTARPHLALRAPAVPDDRAARRALLVAAASMFAGFAITGLFTTLVPEFVASALDQHNLAVVGAIVGLLFAVATATQVASSARWWPRGPHLTTAGLVSGLAGIAAGLWAQSVALFVLGTVLAGVGFGLAARAGVDAAARVAGPTQRADFVSTVFLAAYLGATTATLALGLLTAALGQRVAVAVVASGLVLVTVLAAVAHHRDPTRREPDHVAAGHRARRTPVERRTR